MSSSSSTTFYGSCACACGDPLIMGTSWTKHNPGRRYYICRNYNAELGTGGCGYNKWLDGEVYARSKEVIADLLHRLTETEQHLSAVAEENNDLLLLSDVSTIEKYLAEKEVVKLIEQVDELKGEKTMLLVEKMEGVLQNKSLKKKTWNGGI